MFFIFNISVICRWSVLIDAKKGLGFSRAHHKSIHMYNYLSVGVDAQVTLNFHRTRESRFYLFSHRIFNKVIRIPKNDTFFGVHIIM